MNTGSMLELLWALCGTTPKASLEPAEGWRFDEETGTLYIYPWFKGPGAFRAEGPEGWPHWVEFRSYKSSINHQTLADYPPWKNDIGKIKKAVIQNSRVPAGMFDGGVIEEVVALDGCKEVEESAFENCYDLKAVYLANSVTTVGSRAFANCSSLERVHANGVETLGAQAFYYCEALTELRMGNLRVCGYSKYGNALQSPFFYCTALKELHFPSLDGRIPNVFLYYCENVEVVDMPIIEIGQGAFRGSKIKAFDLSRVEKIGNEAFAECVNLEEIVLPEGLESRSDYFVRGCESLKRVVGGCVYGTNAYRDCKNLETVESYKQGFDSQFYGCSSLTQLGGEGYLNLEGDIGAYEFDGCTSLDVFHDYTGTRPNVKHIEYLHRNDTADIRTGAPVHVTIDTTRSVGEINLRYETKRQYCENRYMGRTDSYIDFGNTYFETPIWGVTGDVLRVGAGHDWLSSPWNDNRDEIRRLYIETPTWKIGENAFAELYLLIGEVYIPRTVQTIEANAFAGVTRLPLVLYEGSAAEWNAIQVAGGNEALLQAERIIFNWNPRNQYNLLERTLTVSTAALNHDFKENEEKEWAPFDKECTTLVVELSVDYHVGNSGGAGTWYRVNWNNYRIPSWAFAGCSAATMCFPIENRNDLFTPIAQGNRYYYTKVIGSHAFDGCGQLMQLIGLDGDVHYEDDIPTVIVRDCEDYAFRGCGLFEVRVGSYISFSHVGVYDTGEESHCEWHGYGIFAECPRMYGAYGEISFMHLFASSSGLPPLYGVHYAILAGMFKGCTSLVKITTYAQEIRESAFENCISLMEINSTGVGVAGTIRERAFAGTGFVNLILEHIGYNEKTGNSELRIATGAFANCPFLTSIAFWPDIPMAWDYAGGYLHMFPDAFKGSPVATVLYPGTLKSLEGESIDEPNAEFWNAMIICTDGIWGVDNL